MIHTYLAHRVSGNVSANLESAKRWYRYLARCYDIVPVAPWIVLCEGWPEDDRELGLSIDLAAIDRCSTLVACGEAPGLSSGMELEVARARSKLKAVVDLTGIGWRGDQPEVVAIVDGAIRAAGIGRRQIP